LPVRLAMSFQPLAGISWGMSAPRPRSLFAIARGSVWWPADGRAAAGRRAELLGSRPTRAGPGPPAVAGPGPTGGLAPHHHGGGGEHARRQGRPGHPPGQPRPLPRFARHLGRRGLPTRPVCIHDYHPTTNRTGPFGMLAGIRPTAAQDLLAQPTCLTGISKVQTAAATRPASLRRCAVRLPGGPGSDAGRRRTVEVDHLAGSAEVAGSTEVHAR